MRRSAVVGLSVVATAGLVACGSKKSSAKPTAVAVSITPAGKSTTYSVPATVKGGLVQLKVTNKDTKAPHGAQLIRIIGNHTTQQALKEVASNSNKTPSWLRAEGGVGPVGPGQTERATVNLPAGKYLAADLGGPGSNGPPGYKAFTVAGGKKGSLPSTPTTITAANPGKDKYKWQISGALKAGANNITFKSKGKTALHLIAAARITGNPSQAQIVKGLGSNGPPPKFVDQTSFTSTAILDGGSSQVTPLTLSKPGKYVLFCQITDRDGGKPHFKEGLLTTVTVK